MQQAFLLTGRPEKDSRHGLYGAGGPTTRPGLWFGVLAVAFVVVQLTLVPPGMGLGWDETVYASQVSPHAPAAFFSAPRARGISYLAAPVTGFTGSVTVLRWYLAVLSGGALFVSLWVWRRLLPVPVLTLAGALFATLWISVFYGPQVMPNLWVAFAALIAAGCFLRAVHDRGDLGALFGLGGAMAVAALMRPSDAVWLALPLVAGALCVRSWRRPAVLLVVAAGAGLGAAQWVVEAYTAYGGLGARLHRAGEIQGGLGWHPAFGHQLRALEGRALCRPCDVPWRSPATALWWFALPLLVACGVWAGVRAGRRAVVWLPVLAGLSLSVPYLLMIDYAAPRFLLPAYALLSLPVAVGLARLVTRVRPDGTARVRPSVAAVLSAVLVTHVVSQFVTAHSLASRSADTRDAIGRVAAELNRQGVRPPCTVSGVEAARIGFRAGCASRQLAGHDGSITPAELRRTAERQPVAVLVAPGRAAPAFTRGWRTVPLPALPGQPSFGVRLSPSARP